MWQEENVDSVGVEGALREVLHLRPHRGRGGAARGDGPFPHPHHPAALPVVQPALHAKKLNYMFSQMHDM